MSAPAWVCTIDDNPATAALAAALLAMSPAPGALAVASRGGPKGAAKRSTLPLLTRVAQACARRGLPASVEGERVRVGARELAIVDFDAPVDAAVDPSSARLRLRDGRVEVERGGSTSRGEPAELLAAAPLLEAFERGAGLRWALVSVITGRDPWSASVDLCERRPGNGFEAGLARWFPSLVGRVGYSEAVGPQLGSAIHLSVLLGAGASVDGVRDLLGAQAEHTRSRWPRVRSRPGFGSADCIGDGGLALDLDAITSAGPLLRLTAYFDGPTLLAHDAISAISGPAAT